MPHSHTDEQISILDAARSTQSNLMISALAGTGKTSTLEAIEQAVPRGPILYLVFNKKNATEAEGRMSSTTTVRTFNSIGHRIWAASQGKNLKLDADKTRNIFKDIAANAPSEHREAIWSVYSEVIQGVALAKALGYIPKGSYSHAKRLLTQNAFYGALDEVPDDLTGDLIDAILTRSIKQAYDGIIDYNDQIYMPALFGGTYPRFPLVLVDEYQDLSPVNHALLQRLVKGRLIGVGDPNQCHLPGTMIYVTGKGNMPIEELTIGTNVAYYSTRTGKFVGLSDQGRPIEAIHKEYYSGNLVKITVNNKIMQVTPNHKCIARINRDAHGHVLYLMKKGDQFRLGISKIRSDERASTAVLGPIQRARQEKADSIWLLDVYSNFILARAHEQYYSTQFQIPTLVFESTEESVELFWEMIGDNSLLGEDLLKAFDRDIKYPFWTPVREGFVGFHRAGIIEATNLIPEIMTMLTYPTGEWHSISIELKPYEGLVYGITVAHREESKRVYLANDILVHNCIYAFRGAKATGMNEAIAAYHCTEFPLSMSFRCPSAIVKHVQWHVPSFRAAKEGGDVTSIIRLDGINIREHSTVICRNNAPILKLAFNLLGSGRSVSVAGGDIGPRIINVMRKLGPDSLEGAALIDAINEWEALKLAKESKTASDMAACMRIFAEHGRSLHGAMTYAKHLFEQKGTTHLTTGHKAKGLEWEDVYHLDPWHVRRGHPSRQDRNLDYVVSTRSCNRLTEIESEGLEW